MTQDEIIDLAIQAGASPDEKVWLMYAEELEVFAKLVAAKEREACAKVCDEAGTVEQWDGLSEAADRIRAKGEA
jgi:hypothetical protein